ncbi:STAS domain-containing protein [Streptacidiphilus sp. PAMC 29251]
MSADLSVAVGRSQGLRVLLSVAGEIDHDNVDPLTEAATRLIDQGYRHLVLDLSGVGFCDSSGLNCMIRIFHHAAAVDGSLVLTAIPDG